MGTAAWFLSKRLFIAQGRRALANKTEAERTLTWRFSPDGYEVSTPDTYTRARWKTVHRFLDGPSSFVLYASEALTYIVPKRALRVEDVATLRAMFASSIQPRKRPFPIPKLLVGLVLFFIVLTVVQYLVSDYK